jgi:hypothetical protein
MKKTRSRKSRDTVPLRSFSTKSKVRFLHALCVFCLNPGVRIFKRFLAKIPAVYLGGALLYIKTNFSILRIKSQSLEISRVIISPVNITGCYRGVYKFSKILDIGTWNEDFFIFFTKRGKREGSSLLN